MKVNENVMIENVDIENNNVAHSIFFGLSIKQVFIIPLNKIPPTKNNNKSMYKDKNRYCETSLPLCQSYYMFSFSSL
jgi:hypothetical protein